MARRLLVEVEGQTEEQLVNEILAPHLFERGYEVVGARLVGNQRLRARRGGIRNWDSVSRDILQHLREDTGRIVTTMVDYYALPASGRAPWPGRAQAALLMSASSLARAAYVEEALASDINSRMDPDFNPRRFVPFVVMHEFEGLLFSNCRALPVLIGDTELEPKLTAIRNMFPTPEDINDSPQTAPSKRLEALVPNYEKPLYGVETFREIGLQTVRAECPHFHQWLVQLEELGFATHW